MDFKKHSEWYIVNEQACDHVSLPDSFSLVLVVLMSDCPHIEVSFTGSCVQAWRQATDKLLFTVQMDDSFYAPNRKASGFMAGNGTVGTPRDTLIEAHSFFCSWKQVWLS